MRKSLVRIESSDAIVRDAGVFVRNEDDEWVDIRRCVTGATVTLEVGAVSRAHLDLIFADALVEAVALDEDTQRAFADVLSAHGWSVAPPRPTFLERYPGNRDDAAEARG